MSIKPMAECDGPTCDVTVPSWQSDYPDNFIVIDLGRARDGLPHGIGQYGFCSRSCLAAWATWTKP